MMRNVWIGVAGALLVTVSAGDGFAQRPFGIYGLGGRTGFSVDPDQFVIGGHLDMGDIAHRLQFQPTVEAGFGSDMTIVTVLGEANYHFRDPDEWDSLTLYVGGGFGPVFIDTDAGNDVEVGLTVQSGVRKQIGDGNYSWFGEVRYGIADTPDWKFVGGFTLGN